MSARLTMCIHMQYVMYAVTRTRAHVCICCSLAAHPSCAALLVIACPLHGHDVDMCVLQRNKSTALHYVAKNGNIAFIRALVAAGASMKAKNVW
jgi:hypothetical protein